MLATILKRVLISIPLLVVTTAIAFVLQALMPGDPARVIVGIQGSQEAYERVRGLLNLDLPLWQQYGIYLGNLLRGDLGNSLFSNEPVAQSLANRLPVTLSIIVGAILLGTVVGVLLGVASAKLGGWLARVVDVVSLLGLALPSFWLALVLVTAFAITIPLFPATGYVPFTIDPGLWAASLVLPVVALSIGSVASIAKITRDGVSDALDQDYIRTLRAAGVGESSLLWRHALKNAGVPIVTIVGVSFVAALSGSLFVENVFVLPGLGSLVNEATTKQDIPVVQGVALAYALIVVVVNLLVDITYTYLNPKVKTR